VLKLRLRKEGMKALQVFAQTFIKAYNGMRHDSSPRQKGFPFDHSFVPEIAHAYDLLPQIG
jgi:hypothetical protein